MHVKRILCSLFPTGSVSFQIGPDLQVGFERRATIIPQFVIQLIRKARSCVVTIYFAASCASRRPENCQRVAGPKKLRYVARMCVAGVTHEPPRSTTCDDMNLPLYSPSAPGSGL